MLNWLMFNSPLVDNSVYLYLSDRLDITQAGWSTNAMGGYGDGQLVLTDVPDAVADDCASWLGKRVVATDGEGGIGYEGFIATVEFSHGHHLFRKSLEPMFDCVHVTYYTPDKKHPGNAIEATVQVDDVPTELKYGIKTTEQDIKFLGALSLSQARGFGLTYLNQTSTTKQHRADISSGMTGVDSANVNLTLYGYSATLSWLRMHDLGWPDPGADIGTIVAQTVQKIHNDNNTGNKTRVCQFLANDVTHINTIGNVIVLFRGYPYTTANDIITKAALFGDPNNHRVLFQVWENRTPWLFSRPTVSTYSTSSQMMRILDTGGAPVPPWKVRAGNYLVFRDFPAPSDYYADIDLDPRAVMIERTSWDDLNETLSIEPTSIFSIRVPHKWHGIRARRKSNWWFGTVQGGGSGGGGATHPGKRYGRQTHITHTHPRRRK